MPYQPSPNFWRSAHIHFKVERPGYRTLVTELFFAGGEKQDADPIFKPQLAMPVERRGSAGQPFESVVFDIVLAPA